MDTSDPEIKFNEEGFLIIALMLLLEQKRCGFQTRKDHTN